jgi:hypothetical protein
VFRSVPRRLEVGGDRLKRELEALLEEVGDGVLVALVDIVLNRALHRSLGEDSKVLSLEVLGDESGNLEFLHLVLNSLFSQGLVDHLLVGVVEFDLLLACRAKRSKSARH